jgi:aspartate/methionine/tyrosine aminotransferase
MIIKPAERLNIVQEYYFSKKLREIGEMNKSGKNVINLGIGSPDMPPSNNVINVLQNQAQRKDIHGYQSYNGIFELRDAFAKWYKRYYNVELNPDNEILPVFGSKEAIIFISMAFLNEGDEVLVPDPGYPTYSSVSQLVQAKIRTYNLKEENNWYPDFYEIEKQDISKVKLMWVNYPNMPTGAPASIELFESLVNFALKHNILICNDNPYSFLNEKPISILSIKNAKECAIELNSLSKSHNMAGWRIGVIAASNDYLSTIIKVSSNVHSGMFYAMQKAAVEALNLPDSWYKELNNTYDFRRKAVFKIFDYLNCAYNTNQKGLFVWAKINDKYKNAEILSDIILNEANVFITPGFIFGKNGENYLRISLCSDIEIFNEALSRIKKIQSI